MNRTLAVAFGAALTALCLAAAAAAEPAAAPTAPPGPPAAVATPPALPGPAALPAVAKKPASDKPAPWLRPAASRPAPPLETKAPISPIRIGVMLLVVAALGGFAYYAKKKKQAAPAAVATEKLRVLGSTRVGPKALAVVAEVGGKRLLLGVTEQAVNTLAWLDDVEETEEEAHSDVSSRAGRLGQGERAAAARPSDERSAEGPSGFLRVLRNAVGSADRTGAPADQIATSTRDEVHLSRKSQRRARDEAEPLEGQVAGLVKRRREPS